MLWLKVKAHDDVILCPVAVSATGLCHEERRPDCAARNGAGVISQQLLDVFSN